MASQITVTAVRGKPALHVEQLKTKLRPNKMVVSFVNKKKGMEKKV